MILNKNGKIFKKNLILLIVLICIIILIAGLLGAYFAITSSNKIKYENIISDETNSMYSNFTVDDAIKTKGDYAIVEQGLKEYYTEYINDVQELKKAYSQNLLTNCLSSDNINSDGPEFNKTRETIKNIKDNETETIQKLNDLTTEDYIEKKSKELNLNDYYTNLFITQIKENLKVNDNLANIKNTVESYDKWLSSIGNVLDLLTNNKSAWKINNGKLIFTSNSLLNNYNTYISDIQSSETSLKTQLDKFKL